MKIIDAFWEKRNLGVKTVEVILEMSDNIEEIEDTLNNVNAEYVVVKCPTTRIDISFFLQNQGYTFIEANMNIVHDLKNFELHGIYKRLTDCVSYEMMTQNDIEKMFIEIKKGMFNTDRIYLDPYFTHEQAANRYIGWIKDELGKGSDVYKYIYKDADIGFFTIKDLGNGIYDPFLAGIYPDYLKTGLGINMSHKTLTEIKRRGGKKVSTHVSANNTRAVAADLLVNYKIKNVLYVYVKHKV